MSQTDIKRHKARKVHHCDGCGGEIRPGQTYERWRWYGDWGAVTVRAHVACNAVLRAYNAPADFGDGYVLGPDVMAAARAWHGPQWLDEVTRDVDPGDGAVADLRAWWVAVEVRR